MRQHCDGIPQEIWESGHLSKAQLSGFECRPRNNTNPFMEIVHLPLPAPGLRKLKIRGLKYKCLTTYGTREPRGSSSPLVCNWSANDQEKSYNGMPVHVALAASASTDWGRHCSMSVSVVVDYQSVKAGTSGISGKRTLWCVWQAIGIKSRPL